MSAELKTKSAQTTGATARVASSVMRVLVHLHSLPKKRMLTQPTATRNADISEAAVADLIALTTAPATADATDRRRPTGSADAYSRPPR